MKNVKLSIISYSMKLLLLLFFTQRIVAESRINYLQLKDTEESEYISKIPQRSAESGAILEPVTVKTLSTVVQELQDAGIHLDSTKSLKTLSYTDISRLLALWQITHQRNYYEMNMYEKQMLPTLNAQIAFLSPIKAAISASVYTESMPDKKRMTLE